MCVFWELGYVPAGTGFSIINPFILKSLWPSLSTQGRETSVDNLS